MRVQDIANAVIQTEPSALPFVDEQFGLWGTGSDPRQLGYFSSATYVDGVSLTTASNLAIKMVAKPYRNYLLTLKTGSTPSQTYVICIPKLISESLTRASGGANIIQRILGIRTAHAEVNMNSNSNTNTAPNYTYYVDVQGNLYSDAKLTQRLNTTVNCSTVVSRAYSPTSFTAIASTPEYNYGEGQWLKVIKNWPPELSGANYSKLDGFMTFGDQTMGWKQPASFYHRRSAAAGTTGSPWVFPTTKLRVQTNLGTTELCVPGKSLLADEYQLYFYDTLGVPHSDIFLQKPVACGETPNLCTAVKCSVTPNDPCCLKVDVK
jgi:hypothetical protein